MSTIMFARYDAISELAAAGGGKPFVGVKQPNSTSVMTDADGNAETLDYSGKLKTRVLAIIPAEALGAYTLYSGDGLDQFVTLSAKEVFWWIPIAGSVLYFGTRLLANSYQGVWRALRHGGWARRNKAKFILAEIARVLIPFIATIAWFALGETEPAKSDPFSSIPWTDWARDLGDVQIAGWGFVAAAIAIGLHEFQNWAGFPVKQS